MSKTWEYLQRIQAEYGGEKCTRYRLSKLLNVTPGAVYRYEDGKGEADDRVAIRIAALLELPAVQVMADIHAARAESEGKDDVAKAWRDAALQLGRVAFFAGAVGVTAASAVDAGGPSGIRTQNQGIMSPLL